MRLASKIFLTSTLVIAVLAGVGALSLRAVDRLVTVNREITTATVPALRLAASVREASAALTRLEARTLALRHSRREPAWPEPRARARRAGRGRPARGAHVDGRADRPRRRRGPGAPGERARGLPDDALPRDALGGDGRRRRGLLPRAAADRERRRDRPARALVQLDGGPAP